jgi:uncharacterized protein (TIGR02217 family)
MPTQFVEQQFPSDISYGSKGGPGFSTTVFTADSGAEQRNINWQDARARYDVSHGIRDKTDMDTILAFFYNMKGRAIGFRYKDWADYQLVSGEIGPGDGVDATWQIVKKYTVGSETYTRELKKIVANTVTVIVEGVTKVETTDYTLDYNTGIITFGGGDIPALADNIVVSCEFDVPVRFDTDEMEITQEAWNLETWDSIQLVELKL